MRDEIGCQTTEGAVKCSWVGGKRYRLKMLSLALTQVRHTAIFGVLSAVAGLMALCAPVSGAFGQTKAVARVTALNGPVDCRGLSAPYLDAPFCTAPNRFPLGSWAPYRRPSLTYTDHNFGGRVTTFAPFGNDGNAYVHAYMDPSPFSKTMKYMLVINQHTTQLDAIDGHTGANRGYNGVPYGNDQWFPFDPHDEESYYYIAGTSMYKHTINRNRTVRVHDFSADGFTTIHNRGRTIVAQNGWTAVYDDSRGVQKVCAINVSSFTGRSVTYYCAPYNTPQTTQHVGIGSAAGVQLTRGVDSVTGKQYVVLLMGPAATIFSIDSAHGRLEFEMRGPEADASFDASSGNHNGICQLNERCFGNANNTFHGTSYQDSAGRQYWFAAMDLELPGGWRRVLMTMPFSAGNRMMTLEQNGGAAHIVMVTNGPNTFGDVHMSCANNADACVAEVGTDESNYNPSRPPSSFPAWPHYGEIIALKDNMTSAVRLAYSYSTCFSSDSYWCQPRASISPDGSTVVFDSNWGVPNREYPNVVNTGTLLPGRRR